MSGPDSSPSSIASTMHVCFSCTFVQQAVVDGAKGKKAAKQPRKFSSKCWMASNFPMSLRQLIPILDIVGYTNKHLARVGKFMHKYGDMDLFPVKLQACPGSSVASCD